MLIARIIVLNWERLEDANGQFNELTKEREKRVENFIYVLSVLAAFSAFADLAYFLEMFSWPSPHWFSFITISAILIIAFLYIFKLRKR